MPTFEVTCYRTAERTERVSEVVVIRVNTDSRDAAETLARTLAEHDRALAWAVDEDAPAHDKPPLRAVIHVGKISMDDGRDSPMRIVSEGVKPYGANGAVLDMAPAFQPPRAPPAPREMVKPPAHATTGGKVALPPYDPQAEAQSARVADLLTQDATGAPVTSKWTPETGTVLMRDGAPVAIGLEPADPKELQNDAPGAHGLPVPPYEPWTPQGSDHMLDKDQRATISNAVRDNYDRQYPGERIKQEEAARVASRKGP